MTVDASGHVAEVRPSILTFSTPGPFAEEFRSAVEAALRQWRFVPAEVQETEPIVGLDQPANRNAMPGADYSGWVAPSAVAEVITFLASPDNQVTRGAVIPVYGGA